MLASDAFPEGEDPMNHLIVYAHPNPKSFSGAICEHLAKLSKKQGHAVFVRDLYKLKFNPVLAAADFDALRQGKTPKDIKTEQMFVTKSELITLIFPLWWTGYPAILKGWIDRILLNGFAFKHSPQSGITPMLTGKKVQLITTMGASVTEYERNGLMDAMAMTMGDNVWSFCGCEDAGMIALGEIPGATDAERRKILRELSKTLEEALTSASSKKTSESKTAQKRKKG
jgi:NAD(P)H dehydrogenase (quinone)